MGLMESGCKPEDFGRPVQPAASNRPRCRAKWWCLSDICDGELCMCVLGKKGFVRGVLINNVRAMLTFIVREVFLYFI